MAVLLGQEVNLERLDSRDRLVLLVRWELLVLWDQPACRENEAEPDRLDLWENVVQPATLENQVLWVRWESSECQVFLVAQE